MNIIKKVFIGMGVVIFIYITITNLVFRFKNPDQTQIQAFLHIPRTLMLDMEK